jgi:hypothetical protein
VQQPSIYRRNKAIYLSLLCLVFWGFSTTADSPILLWKIAQKGSWIECDKLGNVMVVNKDQITKIKPDGSFFRTFSNKQLGDISSLDATNPLKILVFYQPFSRILFLDNTLSENGSPIYLEDYGLEQASAVCSSYDNGFWVYNQIDFSLYRFDQKLQQTNTTRFINQFLGFEPNINYMVEAENLLFLNDAKKGILVFDVFGTYLKTIPITGLKKFQIFNELVIYQNSASEFSAFHTKKLFTDTLQMPEPKIESARWFENMLYVLKSDSLKAYRFN